MAPRPPSRAMAMAMGASVTVSILLLMMGMARVRWRVRGVLVVTAVRLATEERLGTSSTSSNVRPSESRNFMFIQTLVERRKCTGSGRSWQLVKRDDVASLFDCQLAAAGVDINAAPHADGTGDVVPLQLSLEGGGGFTRG